MLHIIMKYKMSLLTRLPRKYEDIVNDVRKQIKHEGYTKDNPLTENYIANVLKTLECYICRGKQISGSKRYCERVWCY